MGYGYGREDSEEDLVQWRKYCENMDREKKTIFVNEVKRLIFAIEDLEQMNADAIAKVSRLKNSVKLLADKY